MTTAAGVALALGVVLAGLVVVLLLAVGLQHRQRTRTQARDARRRAELMPTVHALLDDDGDDPAHGPHVTSAPALLDELVLDLLPQLRGSDRRALQRVLGARGVVDRAAADLTARAAWRRGRAATLLGSAAATDHTPALAACLTDRSADVRSAAARALGKAGDPASVTPLLVSLAGPRALPVGVVGMALLDLGTPVLPALRTALTEGSAPARALAAEVLGVHGDPLATPGLLTLLEDRGQPTEVRRAAAAALGRIGSPQATAELTRLLATGPVPALQRVAAEALGRIGDPAGISTLVSGLHATDPGVRAACADALAAIGDEGRGRLRVLAVGTSPAGRAALAALDAVATARQWRRPVTSR
ncbi:HEAT repeat domain-containing protein [Modestobacter sp. VKM Ac-2983]|uniref:HEAT repeat domain-containing protein n=1 Tax=Modestobacter sp. VKM Ac-2983 TaxID=3004137 RepID=UPI0022AB5360|nr:HEAT repeat domain-containing protein [Modestobacter sp. VKM Ac-2983]MCZ2803591.1 HEAT repeat domain-containing protein [Modestobacter sp. VKM Ac-2983]